ncbi:MAG: RHS repeat-associated core domain-containing protein [Calditrichaceae bacterium]
MTVNEFGQAEAYNDYYPFGLQMPGRSVNNAMTDDIYKFGGKELDEESGLNWYYFGARDYNPLIGRWLTVDPLTAFFPSFTPYNYVYNNPIRYIDLYGLSPTDQMQDEWEGGWDAVWAPSNGSLPGWGTWKGSTQSYLENYTNEAGGHFSKQYYGTASFNDPITWLGYDWLWTGWYPIGWGEYFSTFGSVQRNTGYLNGQMWANDHRLTVAMMSNLKSGPGMLEYMAPGNTQLITGAQVSTALLRTGRMAQQYVQATKFFYLRNKAIIDGIGGSIVAKNAASGHGGPRNPYVDFGLGVRDYIFSK